MIQKYLALSQNRTVIYVTHRISVATLADRIIVFRAGKICQDGTYRGLMQQDGGYHRLYTEQAKWYKD